MTWRRF